MRDDLDCGQDVLELIPDQDKKCRPVFESFEEQEAFRLSFYEAVGPAILESARAHAESNRLAMGFLIY
jgi:predicted DNA-binding protein (UPF0251 family)